MQKYNPQKIEKKWQKKWYASTAFKAQNNSKKETFYVLVEFPYPSGDGLHVGHCRSYTALDIISRKRRMQGFNVLYPMGWDAFGLPTENYAIKMGVHPSVITKKNTDNFRKQMKNLGFSFDWSREVNTTDPKYYKWTQWIFIKLFEKGLAYKDRLLINWCPKDKIGLANEEVVNGKCERCGTPVEKKEKEQWVIKITQYADRLIKDLDLVDYPERVKTQQKEWIGRSEGVELEFPIANTQFPIKVFTTRPDTLFGCTFLVLAPEHEIIEKIKSQIKNWQEVEQYIKEAKNKSDLQRQEGKEKTGIELKGIKAVNPANKKEIPIFIADYVMAGYGTGAIMAVPAHDERDFEFAQKYQLPIQEVVVPNMIDRRNLPIKGKKIVERRNVHAIVRDIKTGKYLARKTKQWEKVGFPMGGIEDGESPIEAAIREVKEETGYTNLKLVKVLDGTVRAEYFAIHKDENRVAYTTAVVFDLMGHEQLEIGEEEKKDMERMVWLDESQLTYENMVHVEVDFWKERLHKNHSYNGFGVLVNSDKFDGLESQKAKEEITKFVGGKKTVNYKLRDWIFSRQHYWGEPIPMVFCGDCGWQTVSEKELPVELPKVKKYEPTDTGESPLAAMEKWVNVKCPKCKGVAKRETDTMPNWAGSNWYFLRYTDPKNNKKLADEKALNYWLPVDWYNGGMEHTTLHLLYSRFIFKFLWDIGAVPKSIGSEPYKKRTSHGIILGPGGVKMSKSKGNVINPDDVVKQYGADTLRVYEMFMGPFEQMIPWDEKGIVGARRFLEKVYTLCLKPDIKQKSKNQSGELVNLLNKTIKKVGEDIEAMKFNTAISTMMTFVNEWSAASTGLNKKGVQKFLAILSPFAPHLAAELCLTYDVKQNIAWPEYEQAQEETVMMIVSVNGRVRDKMELKAGLDQSQVEGLVLHAPKIKPWLEGKQVKKIIFIPNKLINIVI